MKTHEQLVQAAEAAIQALAEDRRTDPRVITQALYRLQNLCSHLSLTAMRRQAESDDVESTLSSLKRTQDR